MSTVQVGDIVTPIAAWNETTLSNRLPVTVEVLQVKHGQKCESGIMVKINVRDENGPIWLDLHWFKEHSPDRWIACSPAGKTFWLL